MVAKAVIRLAWPVVVIACFAVDSALLCGRLYAGQAGLVLGAILLAIILRTGGEGTKATFGFFAAALVLNGETQRVLLRELGVLVTSDSHLLDDPVSLLFVLAFINAEIFWVCRSAIRGQKQGRIAP